MSHHIGERTTAFPDHTMLSTPCIKLHTSNHPINDKTATFREFTCKSVKAISRTRHRKERMDSSGRMVGRPVDPARVRRMFYGYSLGYTEGDTNGADMSLASNIRNCG